MSPRLNKLDAFWIGLAGCTVVLQVWHFALPIDERVTLFLMALGVLGLWRRHRSKQAVLPRLPLLALSLLIALVLAVLALEQSHLYDDGLYHLPLILWNNHYAIMPGLANLHRRFGFNNSCYLFATLFDTLPGGATHYTAGVFFLVALLGAGQAVGRTLRGAAQLTDYLQILFLIPIIYWISVGSVASINSDVWVMLLGIPICCKLMSFLSGRQEPMHDAVMVIALAALGITFKLSFLIFACGVSLLVFYFIVKRRQLKVMLYHNVPIFTLLILLMLSWLLRGFVLSGYPFFPNTVGAANVDWRVPVADVQAEADWTYSWGRVLRGDMQNPLGRWDWLPEWWSLARTDLNFVTPISLTIIGGCFLLFSLYKHPRDPGVRIEWKYFLPFLPAIPFWFYTVPDARFALIPLWGFAGGIFLWSIARFDRRYLAIFTVLMVILTAIPSLGRTASRFEDIVHGGWVLQANPTGQTYSLELNSGLVLNVPRKPEQDEGCWLAALPCTPVVNPALALRAADNLSSGFTINERQ